MLIFIGIFSLAYFHVDYLLLCLSVLDLLREFAILLLLLFFLVDLQYELCRCRRTWTWIYSWQKSQTFVFSLHGLLAISWLFSYFVIWTSEIWWQSELASNFHEHKLFEFSAMNFFHSKEKKTNKNWNIIDLRLCPVAKCENRQSKQNSFNALHSIPISFGILISSHHPTCCRRLCLLF